MFRGFKRKSSDRDLDFRREFEHNAYNQWLFSMIEECDQVGLRYAAACNQQALDHQEVLPVKVTVHASPGPRADEYCARVEPYRSDFGNDNEVGSTLVGTRVPVKVLFQSTRRGKPARRVGYILSLIDVDLHEGYRVYYFRHQHLVTERMLPRDFSLFPLSDEDRETAARISAFLAAAASSNSTGQSGESKEESSSSALST